MSPHALLVVLATFTLTACNSPAYDAFAAGQEKYASSSASSGEVVTTGEVVTGGAMESTGGSTIDDSTDESTGALGETSAETGEPATSSTGEAENAAPEIFAFAASPDEIFEAGEVKLELEASDDVVEVDVWYGDVLLATVPVDAFPYRFDVTSQSVCEGSQSFTATARDAEGLDGHAARGAVLPAARARERGLHPRPSRRIDEQRGRRHGAGRWRRDRGGRARRAHGAVAARPRGRGAAGLAEDDRGVDGDAGPRREGVDRDGGGARLDRGDRRGRDDQERHDDAPLPRQAERQGGAAVGGPGAQGRRGHRGARGVGGAGRGGCGLVPHEPARSGARVRRVHVGLSEGLSEAGRAVERPIQAAGHGSESPTTVNKYSERARAVVALADGDFVVFGERLYTDDANNDYTRAMAQRYAKDGARDGALWTSPGLKVAHDAILAATVTPTGILAAGWCRHKTPNAMQQICVQEFDVGGALVGSFVETSPTQAEARGVAQDREHKTVISGYTTKPGQSDAWIFGSRGADQPLAWSQTYDGGRMGLRGRRRLRPMGALHLGRDDDEGRRPGARRQPPSPVSGLAIGLTAGRTSRSARGCPRRASSKKGP
jgi:hypothetical protein